MWLPLADHVDFATRDLSSLRKAYYGASIVPGPVLRRLQERWPDLAFSDCFGRSEIGPLAWIAHARTSLAPFTVPKSVHFVAELPRNQNGKLLRRVLRDRPAEG